MAQYREICALPIDNYHERGLYAVWQEDQVKYDSKLGLYRRDPSVTSDNRGTGKWLCKIFDYRYALTTICVHVSNATDDAAKQVSRLKGVKQIVLMQTYDDGTTEHWKKLFPHAKILNRRDVDKFDDSL